MVLPFCFPSPCLSSPLCAHIHTHITLLRSCGPTFNAPNYLAPRSSGCCITSGLASCIFSLEMPLALPLRGLDYHLVAERTQWPPTRAAPRPITTHRTTARWHKQAEGKTTSVRVWRREATRKQCSSGHWESVKGKNDLPKTWIHASPQTAQYSCMLSMRMFL